MAKARLVSVHFRPKALCPSLFRASGLGRRWLCSALFNCSPSLWKNYERRQQRMGRGMERPCRQGNDMRNAAMGFGDGNVVGLGGTLGARWVQFV